MEGANSYLTVTLDLSDPVEIGDFAALFSGMGAQFERYLAEQHPDLKGQAHMFVKEVRKGSIIADLIPSIPDLIGYMDNVLIVGGFGALFSTRVRKLISGQVKIGRAHVRTPFTNEHIVCRLLLAKKTKK